MTCYGYIYFHSWLFANFHLEQTQENMQRFENQAGLTDTGYSPHKGLSAEETRFHRLADINVSVHKGQEEDFVCPGAEQSFSMFSNNNYLCELCCET